MKTASICKAGILLIPLVWVNSAHGHGIAGNLYFDGTLTFDDPAVADEAILPYYANTNFPMQGSNVSENRINWAFARLLMLPWRGKSLLKLLCPSIERAGTVRASVRNCCSFSMI